MSLGRLKASKIEGDVSIDLNDRLIGAHEWSLTRFRLFFFKEVFRLGVIALCYG
jgi:hypothetical protein